MKYTMTERNKKWVSSFSGFGYNHFVGGQDYGLNISSAEAACRLYVSYMSDVSYRADMISRAVIRHQPCLVQGGL